MGEDDVAVLFVLFFSQPCTSGWDWDEGGGGVGLAVGDGLGGDGVGMGRRWGNGEMVRGAERGRGKTYGIGAFELAQEHTRVRCGDTEGFV